MKYIIEDTTLTNIANAIRNKNGESEQYTPEQMPGKIEEIEGGGSGGGYTAKYIYNAIKNGTATTTELINDIENGTYINGKEAFRSDTSFDYSKISSKNLKIADGNYMFAYTSSKLNSVDMSKFDVSEVLDFSYMFHNCGASDFDLSNWKMINATDFKYMFSGNTSLGTVKFGKLNFSKVETFESMFYNCKNLTNIEGLENIDVRGCENFEKMFGYCQSLTNFDLDLSTWQIGTTTGSAASFVNFLQNAKIKSIKFPEGAKLSFGSMFYYATISELIDLSKVILDSRLYSVSSMLHYADLPGGIILPNFGHVTSTIILGNSSTKAYNLTFGEGNSFGNTSTASSLILDLSNIWRAAATTDCPTGYGEGTYGDLFEAFANSIAANTSGKTRTIKIKTLLYDSLTDEQKTILIDKGYTITYG